MNGIQFCSKAMRLARTRFPRLVDVFASSSDWFIALFTSDVIGQRKFKTSKARISLTHNVASNLDFTPRTGSVPLTANKNTLEFRLKTSSLAKKVLFKSTLNLSV